VFFESVSNFLWDLMKTSFGSFFYGFAIYALRLLASMPFFTRNPFRPTYFLPTAAKSKQKVPLEGNALHPTITPI
jgi:hypothetical protein